MLKAMPEKSRDVRIREEFSLVGGAMSTSRFTHHCREVGIWDADEWESLAFRAAQNFVRHALRKPDESGLPFAGQTTIGDEQGAKVWRRRTLWEFADYELNVKELLGQRDRLHETAVALLDECRDRFGRVPPIVYPASDAAA